MSNADKLALPPSLRSEILDRILENLLGPIQDANLSDDELWRILDSSKAIEKSTSSLIQSCRSPHHSGEEIDESQLRKSEIENLTRYAYPPSYSLVSLRSQIRRLRSLFPQLNNNHIDVGELEIPSLAEGWGAIPRWNLIASDYQEATFIVLHQLRKSRRGKVQNHLIDCLEDNNLSRSERTIMAEDYLYEQQSNCDIIIFPFQWGLNHRDRSPRRAIQCFSGSEFGLGLFATTCLLLTNSKRLAAKGDYLNWACAGDVLHVDKTMRFPVCYSDAGVVEIYHTSPSRESNHFSVPTGFIMDF